MSETPPLIGRELDLAVALEQLKRIERGGASSFLIRGEAGIGKTRLATELLARAEQVGHRALVGRADEFDRGIPYAVFRDVLARLGPQDGEAAQRFDELRAGLDAGAGAAGAPADAHQSLVLNRAVEAFQALTEGSPTVLLVEDVHLADPDSLALLALLARLGELPMLTIATLRPTSAGPARELERLMERLAHDGRGAVVDLEPLDRHEVQALAGATLQAVPDERVVDAALASSGGNPFFAAESMRALQASGALRIEHGRAHLAGNAEDPAAPNTALVARVFGGDEDAIGLAKVVSAFGQFELYRLPLAARLAALDEDDVGARFDRLVHDHVLVQGDEGGYGFAHGILRDTVYGELGPVERRQLHKAIAEELAAERRSGAPLDIAELATHVAESADPGDERAIEVLVEAGRTVSVTAPLVAAEHYGRAAALLPDSSPRRGEALALKARSLHIGSRAQEAAAAGRTALSSLPPGPVRRSTVALVVNGLSIAGRVAEALDVIEDELERGGDPGPLLAQRVHLLQNAGRSDEALAKLPEALAAYRSAPPPQLVAATHLVVYAGDTGDMELTEELLAQLEEWSQHGPPERRVLAHETIALIDRRPGVVASLEQHLEAARELRPNPAARSIGGHYETALVLLLWLRGEWDEALELCRSVSFELEERGAAILAQALHGAECDVLLERGAVDEAGAIARALVSLTEEMTTPGTLAGARVKRALGEHDEALELLSRQRERSRERRTTWKRPELLSELAELLAEMERLDEAREVAEEVDSWAARPCRFEWPLASLRLRAILHDDREAAHAYLELATTERIPFEQARARLVLGSLDVDPREHLTEAHRTFDALGAGPWRRRSAAALRTRGITVPRPKGREGGVLTDTEAQLVRLVRDGLTNKQIASALHYSPKTVEVYLSRVYAKTNCSSRVELVRALDGGGVELPEG
jgi:DNA-binding CsgD family transcriptional regulator